MKTKLGFFILAIALCLALAACEPLIGSTFGLDSDTLARIDAVNATIKSGFGLNAATRQLISDLNETLKNGVRPFDDATMARIDRLLSDIENGLKIGLDQGTLDELDKYLEMLKDAPQDWQNVGENIIKTLEGSTSVLAKQMKRDINEVINNAFGALDRYTSNTITGVGKEFRCNVDFLKDTATTAVNTFLGNSIFGQIRDIINRSPTKQQEKIAWVCLRMPQEVVLEKRDNGLFADENSQIIRFVGYNFTKGNEPTIILVDREGNPLDFPPIYPYTGDNYVLEFSLQGPDMDFSKIPEGARFKATWPNTYNWNGIGIIWPHEPEVATLTITQDNVEVKRGPGIDYYPAGWVVGKGTTLSVLARYQGWWKVSEKEGVQVGWVPSEAGEWNHVTVDEVSDVLPPPRAEIVCHETSGYAPLKVNCEAQLVAGDKNGLNWVWDFGDKTTGDKGNPVIHTFTAEGTYNVTLEVSNTDGKGKAINPVVIAVTTRPAAPVASFTPSRTEGDAPLKVTFTNTSTNNPTRWKWDFDDGTTFSNTDPVSSPDQVVHVVHQFNGERTYHVTLTVWDNIDQSQFTLASADITVRAQPKIYDRSMFIVRYEGLSSKYFDDNPYDGITRVYTSTGYTNRDFVCGIIGVRAEGGMNDPSCGSSSQGCVEYDDLSMEAYMEPAANGEWYINASVKTSREGPNTWDIDTICVHNNVFDRGGAMYVSCGPGGRQCDLRLNTQIKEYTADTGISGARFQCGITGFAFEKGSYTPNPYYAWRMQTVNEGNWFVHATFKDLSLSPAVVTRADVLCFANESNLDIQYPSTSSTSLPSPITNQYDRLLDPPMSEYNCGVFGFNANSGRMDTADGNKEILLAQTFRTPTGAWQVLAGVPRRAGEGESWEINLVCLNGRYVALDFNFDCSSGYCSYKP